MNSPESASHSALSSPLVGGSSHRDTSEPALETQSFQTAPQSLCHNKKVLPRKPLNRIAEARTAQCASLRTISRRTGLGIRTLRHQEHPYSDLTLSELTVWAEALGVPLSELLAEPNENLSGNVDHRAKLIRLMKTVEALRAHADTGATRRISDIIREQLLEMMPELDDITAWPRDHAKGVRPLFGQTALEPMTPLHDGPSD